MHPNPVTATERRKVPRFKINAPLTLLAGSREILASTRDLSNCGVFFYLDEPGDPPLEGEFDFIVSLPPEVTLSTCCQIRCHGRAVREEESKGEQTGVAAEIVTYAIFRDKDTPPPL